MGQPLHVLNFRRFFIENFNKGVTNLLALGLGVTNALQFGEKALLSIRADDFHAHILGEHFHDLIALVQTQQAVVHKHTGQLVTDRPV